MPEAQTFLVEWEPIGRRVEMPAGQSLLAAAQTAGVELVAVCGGAGTCQTCRVRLVQGTLSPLTPEEQETFSAAELAAGYRLACRAKLLSQVTLEIPPASLTAPQRLQVEGQTRVVAVDLPEQIAPGRALGLAVDVGTTKLAGYLVNLSTGQTVAQTGAMNPQIAYGEDVVSRIAYANEHPAGRQILQTRLIETLNQLVAELCAAAGVTPTQIAKAVVVGNPAMHHLFAGLPVRQLGEAPYVPAVSAAMEIAAGTVGLMLEPETPVYLPPNIAGFVGADHVATLLATGMWQTARTILALDIGTNTEISLATGGRLWSCSCASGPVFEGAHIHDGMRAGPGAIERVLINNSVVLVHTIGQILPVGICGSGILDAVAEMLKADILDEHGRFPDKRKEFELVPASATGHRRRITVTRRDVNEIQLAKAAIRAGVEILLKRAGLDTADIEEVLIAGAFGSYLDIGSAIRVGMFPALPRDHFRQVGNAAGAGARLMLVSASQRRLAAEIARQVAYIELTTQPDFTALYVEAMNF